VPRVVAKPLPKTQMNKYLARGNLNELVVPSMGWPRRHEARLVSPMQIVNDKVIELQDAKAPLADTFRPWTDDIEGMIQGRLAERTWREERDGRQLLRGQSCPGQDPHEREAGRRWAAGARPALHESSDLQFGTRGTGRWVHLPGLAAYRQARG